MEHLKLIRFANFDDRTIGRLNIGGRDYYTIENPWKDNAPFISCIPEGEYRMTRVDSPKYGEHMWEVSEVQGRSHILVHVANTAENVTGCIGLGMGLYGDLAGVSQSRVANENFYIVTDGVEEMDLTIYRGHI